MWHAALAQAERDGKVAVVAIVQDQHPDRARLFLQWKRVDWPVLADPLDLLNLETVPLTVAIDEYGIVRFSELPMSAAKTIVETFVNQTFPRPAALPPPVRPPDLGALKAAALAANTASAWRTYGDALAVYGDDARTDDAIDAYRRATRLEPSDAFAAFRLGSALRERYDSPHRQPTDFQDAERQWTHAVDLQPNRYIWRRRVQQYGPRLETPYPFFDWIRDARAEIARRGETPLPLAVEPGESEFADVDAAAAPKAPATEPDARGRIRRDRGEFALVETATVPPAAAPGDTVRVHVTFRPNLSTKAHWNNEVDPLVFWIREPAGARRGVAVPNARSEVSQEPRTVEFEVKVPASHPAGTLNVSGYAVYYVCEDVNGVCVYRRRDVTVGVPVAPPTR